ncbi:TetR/AcrR family transcriptional regulator C-terminal domain-containing protein [Rhizobium sp. SIMBA_035]
MVKTELCKALAEAEEIIQYRLDDAVDLRAALEELCRAWVNGLRSQRLMDLRIVVAGQVHRVPELGRVWIEVGPVRLHERIATALLRLSERFHLNIPDMELAVLQLAGLVVSPHIMYGPFGGGPNEMATERLIVNGVSMFLHEYAS